MIGKTRADDTARRQSLGALARAASVTRTNRLATAPITGPTSSDQMMEGETATGGIGYCSPWPGPSHATKVAITPLQALPQKQEG
jgi:hypothetical protein